jgi:RimJ/RimL family protein N-acetyltransferase
VSLKLATPEDLDTFLRFSHAFYLASPFSPSLSYNPSKVQELFELAVHTQHSKALVLIYHEQDQARGMLVSVASSTPFSDDIVASELAWWVDEEYRGTRGSIELIYAYEEWARRVGAKHITMALLPSLTNPKVENYYEKMGYKKTETSYIKEA